MDYECRTKFINRIFAAQFFAATDIDNIPYVLFKHPNLKIKMMADHIYESSFSTAKKRGVLTEKESIEVSIKQNIWSRMDECNIDNIKKYIDKLENDLKTPRVKYNTITLDEIKKKQADAKIRLNKLIFKRGNITTNTAEKYAEIKKHEYIIREITHDVSGKKLFGWPDIYNYNISSLIEQLASIYFIRDSISTATIRELARSNPWRLYYSPSKKTSSNIFSRHPQDYSEEQISLLYWSSIYDYVYESSDKPEDNIVNNDELLDKWLEEQDKKYKKEDSKLKNIGVNNSKRTGPGITEIFITCTPDKAEEIDKLNGPVVRAAKKKMMQRLGERGVINEYQQGAIFEGVS